MDFLLPFPNPGSTFEMKLYSLFFRRIFRIDPLLFLTTLANLETDETPSSSTSGRLYLPMVYRL